MKRFEIYKQNYLKVLEHNNDFYMNKKPFKISLNQFSYLTHEEYVKRHVNLNTSSENEMNGLSPLSFMNKTSILNATRLSMEQPSIQLDSKSVIPASFDWRQFNMVLPPRHQLQCGSCWAFATVIIFIFFFVL